MAGRPCVQLWIIISRNCIFREWFGHKPVIRNGKDTQSLVLVFGKIFGSHACQCIWLHTWCIALPVHVHYSICQTGLTPLMEAASGGYVEVGRVLLDKGADVNAPPVPSSRDTALTIAADKGHYRFVELLLHRTASVDVKNKKGNSPLWLACNGEWTNASQCQHLIWLSWKRAQMCGAAVVNSFWLFIFICNANCSFCIWKIFFWKPTTNLRIWLEADT